MKEIRKVYVAQKKKEIGRHILQVGVAAALMALLSVLSDKLDLDWPEE